MKTNELNNPFFRPVSYSEQQGIQGGSVLLCLCIAAVVGAAAYQVFGDWDNFKAGLRGLPEIKD